MYSLTGLIAAALLAVPRAEANHCHGVHSGPAAPAAAQAEPTAAQRKGLRAAVVAHIAEQMEDAVFVVYDQKAGKERRLKPRRLDTRMSKTSDALYTVCADFADDDGATVDVDFMVNKSDSGWEVREARVHAVTERAAGGKAKKA